MIPIINVFSMCFLSFLAGANVHDAPALAALQIALACVNLVTFRSATRS